MFTEVGEDHSILCNKNFKVKEGVLSFFLPTVLIIVRKQVGICIRGRIELYRYTLHSRIIGTFKRNCASASYFLQLLTLAQYFFQ